ncbi:MAG: ParB/RepB/Spo0J family partition protein [Opitutaceae bacterium]|jgi:ParB/RepB/Spo0J family partition protein|nr:ParB/RepB/Spo0J family partition protein [Opitutaceae bacterium]
MNTKKSNTVPADDAEKNNVRAASPAANEGAAILAVKPGEIAMFPVAMIAPDPKNRKDHDPEALKALGASLRADGQLQPILIRKSGGVPPWMIVAGERRWLATRANGDSHILARVEDPEDDERASIRKRAAENFHRKNLTAIEEAEVMRQMADTGMPVKAIAESLVLSQPMVSNTLGLLRLPLAVRALVASGKLPRAHGVSLGRFARWPKICARMAELVVGSEWTTKTLEQHDLPFRYHLEQDGMLVEIKVRESYEGDTDPVYVLPEAFSRDPDFMPYKERWVVYFREPGTVDRWVPEQRKQDAARQAKAAAKKARAKAEGKLTPEQAARKRLIEKNRAARAEISEALGKCVEVVRSIKPSDTVPHAVLFAVIGPAFESGCRNDAIVGAAHALGIELRRMRGGRYRAYDPLRALGHTDALRVAGLAVLMRHAEEASRGAGAVPEDVAAVAVLWKGEAKPPRSPAVGKVSPEVAQEFGKSALEKVRPLWRAGKTPREIADALGWDLRIVVAAVKQLALEAEAAVAPAARGGATSTGRDARATPEAGETPAPRGRVKPQVTALVKGGAT